LAAPFQRLVKDIIRTVHLNAARLDNRNKEIPEPAQSSRRYQLSEPPSFWHRHRSKTMQAARGGTAPLASSSKSLSKVNRMRSSRAAHAGGIRSHRRTCANCRLRSPWLSQQFRRTVIAALARWKRQVTLQVHLIVQDSADFDDSPFGSSTKAQHELIACFSSGHIGTVRRVHRWPASAYRDSPGLLRPEILGCPFEDVGEIAGVHRRTTDGKPEQ
jgi:hypothetical protein